jgi:hypothetical protein
MPLAVLQSSLTPTPSVEQLQRVFARVPGLTAYDAHILQRDAFGVLVKDCSEEQARTIHGRLLSEGIQSEVIDHSLLPPIPVSKQVRRLDLTPEHLIIYDPLNRTFPLEWRHITLVMAGAVRLTEFITTRRDVTYDPDTGMTERESDTRERGALHLLADFIIGDGALRYSMRGEDFNFIALGERRTRDVAENFGLFIQDVLARMPHARKSLGTEALLNNELQLYPSKNAYLEEIVWHMWQMKQNR